MSLEELESLRAYLKLADELPRARPLAEEKLNLTALLEAGIGVGVAVGTPETGVEVSVGTGVAVGPLLHVKNPSFASLVYSLYFLKSLALFGPNALVAAAFAFFAAAK